MPRRMPRIHQSGVPWNVPTVLHYLMTMIMTQCRACRAVVVSRRTLVHTWFTGTDAKNDYFCTYLLYVRQHGCRD
jgi:hypothetical protein